MMWLRRLLGRERPEPTTEARPNEERWLQDDDPMAAAVNRAWNTGETVFWQEGDDLPEPGGPVQKVER